MQVKSQELRSFETVVTLTTGDFELFPADDQGQPDWTLLDDEYLEMTALNKITHDLFDAGFTADCKISFGWLLIKDDGTAKITVKGQEIF